MGIVTKNSILLVDYAILNQKEGKPMYEATLESGVARVAADFDDNDRDDCWDDTNCAGTWCRFSRYAARWRWR